MNREISNRSHNLLCPRHFAHPTSPRQRIVGRGTYMYMKYKDVYLLIVMKVNTNAMMAARFLSDFIRLLRSYLQTPLGGDLSEDAIRQNFVVIYELLDEAVDFGYPQVRFILFFVLFILLLRIFFLGSWDSRDSRVGRIRDLHYYTRGPLLSCSVKSSELAC